MMKHPIRKRSAVGVALLALAIGVSACDSPDQFFNQLNKELNALQIVLTGGQSPLAKSKVKDAGPAPKETLSEGEAAARAKQNAEILQEVLRVVYNHELQNRSEFGTLLDSMNQGASIEGLYNGFAHSSNYRKLEAANPGPAQNALAFFASELAETEALLNTPTVFSEHAALPLAPPVQPVDTGTSEVDFPAATPSAAAPSSSPTSLDRHAVETLQRKFMLDFASASVYTMKRILGDEFLKLVDQMSPPNSKDPKKFQAWYGEWVVRMCSQGVDFGIPLRNKADAAFHTQWAATADPDRLRWEILNRVHRVLNARGFPSGAPQGGKSQ